MAPSSFPAVVDAVLVALRAAPALSGVTVLDGPPVSEAVPLDTVCVGHNLDDLDDLSGSITQTWHDTGSAAARDETVEIRCAAWSVNGNGDMAAARSKAFASLAAVEGVLRADMDLSVAAAISIEVTAGDVRQAQTASGCGCRVEFTITATALI